MQAEERLFRLCNIRDDVGATHSFETMPGSSVVNVCVIGAGAAGLCATRHLLDYNKRIERRGQVRVTLFEKSLATGGLWNYDSEAHDSSHSSIYEGLKTNLPKEIMGFPGTHYTA